MFMLSGDKYRELSSYFSFIPSVFQRMYLPTPPRRGDFWQEALLAGGLFPRSGRRLQIGPRGVSRWEMVPARGWQWGFQLALGGSSSSRHPFHESRSRWASPSPKDSVTLKTKHRFVLLLSFFLMTFFGKKIGSFGFVYLFGFGVGWDFFFFRGFLCKCFRLLI